MMNAAGTSQGSSQHPAKWQSQQIAQRIEQLELPEHVRLVAVSKTFPTAAIRAAYAAGLRDFGENKVQEAIAKQAELADLTDITWHFIGHLQANKVRKALQHFDWIHSVTSLKLARRLDHIAAELSRSPICCLQVKLLDDPNKYGWSESELSQALSELAQLSHLKLEGIMAIPPYGLMQTEAESFFNRAYALGQTLANQPENSLPIRFFSMGMSQDFALAIAAGANVIRLGTTLFGERN
ncbi:MAG: YggS family pyridoxal phosphate-dependent enzyme [Cyanobacteria bacterium P01_H01_bin.105]